MHGTRLAINWKFIKGRQYVHAISLYYYYFDFLLLKKWNAAILRVWVFCSHICLCTVCVLSAVEVRRGRWIPWNWSHGRLWVIIWVLGVELRSSERTNSALNCWVLSCLLSYAFAMFSVFLHIEGTIQTPLKTCCAPFSCTYLGAGLRLDFYTVTYPVGLVLLQGKKAANNISIFSFLEESGKFPYEKGRQHNSFCSFPYFFLLKSWLQRY